jgi:hypothetical protein
MNDTLKQLQARKGMLSERRDTERKKQAALEQLFAPLRKIYLDTKDLAFVQRVRAEDLRCICGFTPVIICDSTSLQLKSEADTARTLFKLEAVYIGSEHDIQHLRVTAEFPASDYVGDREYQAHRSRGMGTDIDKAMKELLDVLAVVKVIPAE